MRGDRYGDLVKVTKHKVRVRNHVRAALLTLDRFETHREIAHVKMDITGKTVRVILSDCTVY
jgi:hypothetical protein